MDLPCYCVIGKSLKCFDQVRVSPKGKKGYGLQLLQDISQE